MARRLCFEERVRIEAMAQAAVSAAEAARRLGRHPVTVQRELRRNGGPGGIRRLCKVPGKAAIGDRLSDLSPNLSHTWGFVSHGEGLGSEGRFQIASVVSHQVEVRLIESAAVWHCVCQQQPPLLLRRAVERPRRIRCDDLRGRGRRSRAGAEMRRRREVRVCVELGRGDHSCPHRSQ